MDLSIMNAAQRVEILSMKLLQPWPRWWNRKSSTSSLISLSKSILSSTILKLPRSKDVVILHDKKNDVLFQTYHNVVLWFVFVISIIDINEIYDILISLFIKECKSNRLVELLWVILKSSSLAIMLKSLITVLQILISTPLGIRLRSMISLIHSRGNWKYR